MKFNLNYDTQYFNNKCLNINYNFNKQIKYVAENLSHFFKYQIDFFIEKYSK